MAVELQRNDGARQDEHAVARLIFGSDPQATTSTLATRVV